jgi:DNA polymerase-3 subunit epsilon
MNYTVLDLETANPDYASICQLGIIVVREGKVSEQASVLIDPQDYFDPWHVSLHGIDQSATEAAPTFQQYYDQLAEMLRDQIVVHHGPFDRVAITRACEQCELDQIAAIWLDNQKVVRRTWTEFSTKEACQTLCHLIQAPRRS